jgi:protein TonB
VKKEDRIEYTGPVQQTEGPPTPPAPPAPPRPSVITNPTWIRKPDGADLERFYPSAAKERGTEGRATIECTVTASGTLTACRVISEDPSGSGFGEATIRAATRFKMRPKQVDGTAVEGGIVRIPLRWKMAAD